MRPRTFLHRVKVSLEILEDYLPGARALGTYGERRESPRSYMRSKGDYYVFIFTYITIDGRQTFRAATDEEVVASKLPIHYVSIFLRTDLLRGPHWVEKVHARARQLRNEAIGDIWEKRRKLAETARASGSESGPESAGDAAAPPDLELA